MAELSSHVRRDGLLLSTNRDDFAASGNPQARPISHRECLHHGVFQNGGVFFDPDSLVARPHISNLILVVL